MSSSQHFHTKSPIKPSWALTPNNHTQELSLSTSHAHIFSPMCFWIFLFVSVKMKCLFHSLSQHYTGNLHWMHYVYTHRKPLRIAKRIYLPSCTSACISVICINSIICCHLFFLLVPAVFQKL